MILTPTSAHAITFSCLIIEDDPEFARLLAQLVTEEGGQTVTCGSLTDARSWLAARRFDVLVLDNHLPDGKGFQFFLELARTDPGQTVIVLTGVPELAHAVELTRHGLFDYLSKPLRVDDFIASVRRALVRNRFRTPAAPGANSDWIASSVPMRGVTESIEQVARHAATTVLLIGETGVGKDLVARAIHTRTHAGRAADPPFVAVNCAAVPADMFEAELFGAERGAYTGADRARVGFVGAAQEGTLFLDEIGEVPLALQSKLLRFFESREYRHLGSTNLRTFQGRVIVATNRSLREAVARGHFRQDLLYRLDVARIEIPPLRERREEIPALAERLLTLVAQRYQRSVPRLRSNDLSALMRYDYPGNVRELRNLLERSLLRTPPDTSWLALDLAWLNETPATGPVPTIPAAREFPSANTPMASMANPFATLPLSMTPAALPDLPPPLMAPTPRDLKPMEASEYEVIRHALIESHGGIRRAAAKLGISHQVILRRLQKWPELRAAGRAAE